MSRRGRPSVSPDEPSADIHVTVSVSLYDRVYEIASDRRVSVPEVVRQALSRELETQNSKPGAS